MQRDWLELERLRSRKVVMEPRGRIPEYLRRLLAKTSHGTVLSGLSLGLMARVPVSTGAQIQRPGLVSRYPTLRLHSLLDGMARNGLLADQRRPADRLRLAYPLVFLYSFREQAYPPTAISFRWDGTEQFGSQPMGRDPTVCSRVPMESRGQPTREYPPSPTLLEFNW